MNFEISKMLLFCALLTLASVSFAQQASQPNASPAGAQASFKYIASTLRIFRSTGRLSNNPGIDGADLEYFIQLLDEFYALFIQGFSPDSAMCRFYRSPENGRMTIEEKAELSFSFLRDLPARLNRYILLDQDFQDEVESQFGSILKENINSLKINAVSNQRLPTSNFDVAAMINFSDTTCK